MDPLSGLASGIALFTIPTTIYNIIKYVRKCKKELPWAREDLETLQHELSEFSQLCKESEISLKYNQNSFPPTVGEGRSLKNIVERFLKLEETIITLISDLRKTKGNHQGMLGFVTEVMAKRKWDRHKPRVDSVRWSLISGKASLRLVVTLFTLRFDQELLKRLLRQPKEILAAQDKVEIARLREKTVNLQDQIKAIGEEMVTISRRLERQNKETKETEEYERAHEAETTMEIVTDIVIEEVGILDQFYSLRNRDHPRSTKYAFSPPPDPRTVPRQTTKFPITPPTTDSSSSGLYYSTTQNSTLSSRDHREAEENSESRCHTVSSSTHDDDDLYESSIVGASPECTLPEAQNTPRKVNLRGLEQYLKSRGVTVHASVNESHNEPPKSPESSPNSAPSSGLARRTRASDLRAVGFDTRALESKRRPGTATGRNDR